VLVGGGLGDCWESGLTGSSVAETCPEVLVSFMVVLRFWGGCGGSVSSLTRRLEIGSGFTVFFRYRFADVMI